MDDLFSKTTGENKPMYLPRERLICNLEGKFGDGNDFPFEVNYSVPDPTRGSWRYFGWKIREAPIKNSPSAEVTIKYIKEQEIGNIPQSYLIHFYIWEDLINRNK